MAILDFDVLEAFNSTNARLKEVFTAVHNPDLDIAPKWETDDERKERLEKARQNARDVQIRERFRREEQTRVEEGIVKSLHHWKKFAAVDLSWDSSVISNLTLPLQMYAQGKVNVERCVKLLEGVEGGQQYVKKSSETGQLSIDVPRFIETNINLIRSIIGRRHAAQKNKFNQLWPYYKYEPRSTGLPAKCRADVLSQRVDMMVDQYGYRNHDSQCMLEGLLYGRVVDFVRQSWEVEQQYRRKDPNDNDPRNVEAYITKEGISFFNPHPSRVGWDNAYPLSSINTDTGCEWIFFWDVLRFHEIDDNPYYFNKTAVGWTGRFWGDAGVYNTYRDYFTHYQYTIVPPSTGEIDPAKANDRKAIVGFYSGNQRDAAVFVAQYFRKLVPKDWGFGDYPFPVWCRFICASDSTVIYAEILPSTPAAYLGIGQSDNREMSASMAMDLFSLQDQMTNLATHLMLLCQIELFKAIGINEDSIQNKDDLAKMMAHLKGKNWASEPLVFAYSLLKLQDMGLNPKDVIQIHETKVSASISSVFEAMLKLVELAEKLMAMSPAEQGQPAPREISATEVNEISNTTSSIYSSVSEDIDEFRAAKKRIIYESIVAKHEGQVICPVKDRYTPKTIKAAGFDVAPTEIEDFVNTSTRSAARRQTVLGSARSLVHDYIFTTRDGSERPVNTQAANTLVQLISQVLSVPTVAQAMGKEKLYDLFNEVFRLSGAGVDLNLTLKEGEDDSLGQDDMAQMKEQLQQVMQALNRMAQQIGQNSQDIQQVETIEQHLQESIKGVQGLADRVMTNAKDIQDLKGRHDDIRKSLSESISYKDAPPAIQAQMELQAGFTPAPDHEREAMKKAQTPSKK